MKRLLVQLLLAEWGREKRLTHGQEKIKFDYRDSLWNKAVAGLAKTVVDRVNAVVFTVLRASKYDGTDSS